MPLDKTQLDHLRKDLHFQAQLLGCDLQFKTTWGLFSPRSIDEGSQLLLDQLVVKKDDVALDLGCGYGPLGLAIAKKALQSEVIMVDKDFIAVQYANTNIALNHINNARAQLSDGLNHLENNQRFSLAVTNLPAKTSNEHYWLFFSDIYDRLESDGRFYIVSINGLRHFIKRTFTEIFGNYKKLKQGKTYTVALAIKK